MDAESLRAFYDIVNTLIAFTESAFFYSVIAFGLYLVYRFLRHLVSSLSASDRLMVAAKASGKDVSTKDGWWKEESLLKAQKCLMLHYGKDS